MIKTKSLLLRPAYWKDPENLRAFSALTLMICLIFVIANTSAQNDFIQFHIASRQFLSRLNPYDTSVYPATFRFGLPYPPAAIYFTLLPSLGGPLLSYRIWDVLCLWLYMVTIYLWFMMFRRKEPTWHEFSYYMIAMTTASCFWAFHYHHMIVPVLFFATLAVWLQVMKGRDFESGLAAGLMLIKPHLLLLTAAGLLIRSKNKSRLAAGMLAVFALQVMPFLTGYRPFGDLKAIVSGSNNLATKVYWSDEQSAASILFRELYVRKHHSEYLSFNGIQGRLVNIQATSQLNKLKIGFFAAGFFATLFAFRKQIRSNALWSFSWLLAIGVMISPYSHSYDSLLTAPLLANAILSACKRWPMAKLSVYLLPANFVLTYMLILGTSGKPWWNHLAWCSTIYMAISALIFSYSRINQEVNHER